MKSLLKRMMSTYSSYSSTLLALSGGPDSVVLFFLLLELRKLRPNFVVHAFYLNHNMPNNQEFSLRSYDFVKKLCQIYSVQFHSKTVHISEIQNKIGGSLEDLGRRARYLYLKEIMQQQNLETISTAHHQDDLVETMLMRLFQGVSPASFMAIQMDSNSLIRPLLHISKTEILNLAHQNYWSYLVDPSNLDIHYKRNMMRIDVIPNIQKCFPKFQQKIIQFGQILEEQNHFIKSQLPKWERQEAESFIYLNKLEKIHPYLIKESIKNEIKYLDPNHYLTTRQLEYLKDYLVKNREIYTEDKLLYFKTNIKVTRTQKMLICSKLV